MVALLALLLPGCSDGWDDKNQDPDVADDSAPADDSVDSPAETGETGETQDSGPPPDADEDGSPDDEDCDDADPDVHPGAVELCNGVDDDCSGQAEGEDDGDADGLYDCADYCPVYVAPLATGDGRASDPLGYIQEAVDLAASSACWEVRAHQGTYYENVDWHGAPVNAESLFGPETTIIDGGAADSVVRFQAGETEDARIYGFTITNGAGGDGAGVRVRDSSPTIEGNLITGNMADSGSRVGGGIRVYDGSPSILDNEITDNDAGFGGPEDGCDGGAIDVRGGAPWIEGNYMAHNTAGDGGAIWIAYSDAVIQHNVIVANTAYDEATVSEPDKGGQGGGIDVQIGGPTMLTIRNNVIANNIASTIGGGIAVYEQYEGSDNVTIANNVIAFNAVTETDRGAGFAQWSDATPTVYNNVIYGNVGVGAYAAGLYGTFTYNDVYANTEAYGGVLDGSDLGNVALEPLFTAVTNDANPDDDDFTLTSGSPLVDAGDPAVTDVDGTRSDLGAFGGPEGSGW